MDRDCFNSQVARSEPVWTNAKKHCNQHFPFGEIEL